MAEVKAADRLGYRPGLDGLRGVAVITVVLSHAEVPGFGRAGGTGVLAFFVLSGFLITKLLMEEEASAGGVDLRRFYVRRVRRLLPAAGVVTIVLLVAGASWSEVAPFTLYHANITSSAHEGLGPLAHAWSLSMEEQFYVVWPPLLIVLLRRPRRWLIGVLLTLTAASILMRFALWDGVDWRRVYFAPDTNAAALLIGCLTAVAVGRGWTAPSRVKWYATALIAALTMETLELGLSLTWGAVLVPLATAAAIVAIVEHGAPALEWRPLRTVGRVSYGVYLWHWPIAYAVPAQWPGVSLPVRIGLIVLGTTLATVLSWWLVERPMVRRSRRQAPSIATSDTLSLVSAVTVPVAAGFRHLSWRV